MGSKIEKYEKIVRDRTGLHDQVIEALTAYKESKNESALDKAK